MPGIDDMGIENATQGICGFTSTLYAVHMNRPRLRARLEGALQTGTRSTRLMAEIKTFLVMMKADGKQGILDQITELTRSFPGYGAWTVEAYIEGINNQNPAYSIAMPPEATMEYMRTCWEMKPYLTTRSDLPGDVILGLSRTGGPRNRWNNLAHYVYQAADSRIYSWGEQFTSLVDVNRRKGRNYSIEYRIMVNA